MNSINSLKDLQDFEDICEAIPYRNVFVVKDERNHLCYQNLCITTEKRLPVYNVKFKKSRQRDTFSVYSIDDWMPFAEVFTKLKEASQIFEQNTDESKTKIDAIKKELSVTKTKFLAFLEKIKTFEKVGFVSVYESTNQSQKTKPVTSRGLITFWNIDFSDSNLNPSSEEAKLNLQLKKCFLKYFSLLFFDYFYTNYSENIAKWIKYLESQNKTTNFQEVFQRLYISDNMDRSNHRILTFSYQFFGPKQNKEASKPKNFFSNVRGKTKIQQDSQHEISSILTRSIFLEKLGLKIERYIIFRNGKKPEIKIAAFKFDYKQVKSDLLTQGRLVRVTEEGQRFFGFVQSFQGKNNLKILGRIPADNDIVRSYTTQMFEKEVSKKMVEVCEKTEYKGQVNFVVGRSEAIKGSILPKIDDLVKPAHEPPIVFDRNRFFIDEMTGNDLINKTFCLISNQRVIVPSVTLKKIDQLNEPYGFLCFSSTTGEKIGTLMIDVYQGKIVNCILSFENNRPSITARFEQNIFDERALKIASKNFYTTASFPDYINENDFSLLASEIQLDKPEFYPDQFVKVLLHLPPETFNNFSIIQSVYNSYPPNSIHSLRCVDGFGPPPLRFTGFGRMVMPSGHIIFGATFFQADKICLYACSNSYEGFEKVRIMVVNTSYLKEFHVKNDNIFYDVQGCVSFDVLPSTPETWNSLPYFVKKYVAESNLVVNINGSDVPAMYLDEPFKTGQNVVLQQDFQPISLSELPDFNKYLLQSLLVLPVIQKLNMEKQIDFVCGAKCGDVKTSFCKMFSKILFIAPDIKRFDTVMKRFYAATFQVFLKPFFKFKGLEKNEKEIRFYDENDIKGKSTLFFKKGVKSRSIHTEYVKSHDGNLSLENKILWISCLGETPVTPKIDGKKEQNWLTDALSLPKNKSSKNFDIGALVNQIRRIFISNNITFSFFERGDKSHICMVKAKNLISFVKYVSKIEFLSLTNTESFLENANFLSDGSFQIAGSGPTIRWIPISKLEFKEKSTFKICSELLSSESFKKEELQNYKVLTRKFGSGISFFSVIQKISEKEIEISIEGSRKQFDLTKFEHYLVKQTLASKCFGWMTEKDMEKYKTPASQQKLKNINKNVNMSSLVFCFNETERFNFYKVSKNGKFKILIFLKISVKEENFWGTAIKEEKMKQKLLTFGNSPCFFKNGLTYKKEKYNVFVTNQYFDWNLYITNTLQNAQNSTLTSMDFKQSRTKLFPENVFDLLVDEKEFEANLVKLWKMFGFQYYCKTVLNQEDPDKRQKRLLSIMPSIETNNFEQIDYDCLMHGQHRPVIFDEKTILSDKTQDILQFALKQTTANRFAVFVPVNKSPIYDDLKMYHCLHVDDDFDGVSDFKKIVNLGQFSKTLAYQVRDDMLTVILHNANDHSVSNSLITGKSVYKENGKTCFMYYCQPFDPLKRFGVLPDYIWNLPIYSEQDYLFLSKQAWSRTALESIDGQPKLLNQVHSEDFLLNSANEDYRYEIYNHFEKSSLQYAFHPKNFDMLNFGTRNCIEGPDHDVSCYIFPTVDQDPNYNESLLCQVENTYCANWKFDTSGLESLLKCLLNNPFLVSKNNFQKSQTSNNIIEFFKATKFEKPPENEHVLDYMVYVVLKTNKVDPRKPFPQPHNILNYKRTLSTSLVLPSVQSIALIGPSTSTLAYQMDFDYFKSDLNLNTLHGPSPSSLSDQMDFDNFNGDTDSNTSRPVIKNSNTKKRKKPDTISSRKKQTKRTKK